MRLPLIVLHTTFGSVRWTTGGPVWLLEFSNSLATAINPGGESMTQTVSFLPQDFLIWNSKSKDPALVFGSHRQEE